MLLSLLGPAPDPARASSPAREALEAIDGFVAEAVYAANIPGASLAVVADGRIVLSRGYGRAGLGEDDAPMTPTSLVGIGSVGKTLTATAILQLRDAGRLELDDPVQEHVPEFRLADADAARRMTVRQLLTMTNGLGPASQLVLHEGDAFDLPPRELILRLRRAALDDPPGHAWTYSNLGYVLLGEIVARASGEPYQDYVRRHILAPLGMARTTFDGHAAAQSGLRLHRASFGRLVEVPVNDMPPSYAAAGLAFSTAEDMARYALAQLQREGSRVLSASSLEEAHRGVVPVSFRPDTQFGLGWMSTMQGGHRLVFYEGGGSGMSAGLYLLPDLGLGVAILFNAASYPATWTIGQGVVSRLLGHAPAPVGGQVLRSLELACLGLTLVSWLALALAFRTAVRQEGRHALKPRRLVRWATIGGASLVLAAATTLLVVPPPSGSILAELTALPFRSSWSGWLPETKVALVSLALAAAAWLLVLAGGRNRGKPGRDLGHSPD